MPGYDHLVEEALSLLANNIDLHYRVCIGIVGPPGSGKSTIAEAVKNSINERYQEYLKRSQHTSVRKTYTGRSHFKANLIDEGLQLASPELTREITSGFYSHAEDTTFKPVIIKNTGDTLLIVGRGGLPNSFKIKSGRSFKDENSTFSSTEIATVVPMDGFHLSRDHLDHFRNPQMARLRRGAPFTFDSNNFLELCRVIAKSCKLRAETTTESKHKGLLNEDELFGRITNTFLDVPKIIIPGFDHALKDPIPDQHIIQSSARIIIIEGLYLLLDQENWSQIYDTLNEDNPLLIWNINIDEDLTGQRVAERHVRSEICDTLEEGIKRFEDNDRINGRLLKASSVVRTGSTYNNVIDINNE